VKEFETDLLAAAVFIKLGVPAGKGDANDTACPGQMAKNMAEHGYGWAAGRFVIHSRGVVGVDEVCIKMNIEGLVRERIIEQ
jgi:hypothetical protein